MTKYKRAKNGIKCTRIGDGLKWCSICEEIKDDSCFNRNKGKIGGLSNYCKSCSKHQYKKNYVRKMPFVCLKNVNGFKWCPKCEEMKKHEMFRLNENRHDGLNGWCKECHRTHQKEERKYGMTEREIRYRKTEKGKTTQQKSMDKYRKTDKYKKSCKKSQRKNRIHTAFSSNMRISLRNGKNGLPWEELVNFTTDDLKAHLELQFNDGMSWENYGEWHIDHIRPISSFNIESYTDDDFIKCWSLDNLQPLWAIDNLKKGAKWQDYETI